MEGPAQAGLEVPDDGIRPVELRKILGALASCDIDLVAATSVGDRAKAGQAIGEHRAPRCQVLGEPGHDRLNAEAENRLDFGMNGMAGLIQRTVATIGTLFSDPRPALPPGRSPPR